MMSDPLQLFQVLELDMPAFAADEPLILKPGKYATHNLFCNPKVIPYIASRHAQIELSGGIIALGKLLHRLSRNAASRFSALCLPSNSSNSWLWRISALMILKISY